MTGRRHGRLHMSRAYFFAFPGICVVRFWLSCFDLAWAALSALAAFFCFWSRSFDLGDLSPTGASIRWLSPSAHTIAVAPSEGKRRPGAMDRSNGIAVPRRVRWGLVVLERWSVLPLGIA